jgi:hypothetical protein
MQTVECAAPSKCRRWHEMTLGGTRRPDASQRGNDVLKQDGLIGAGRGDRATALSAVGATRGVPLVRAALGPHACRGTGSQNRRIPRASIQGSSLHPDDSSLHHDRRDGGRSILEPPTRRNHVHQVHPSRRFRAAAHTSKSASVVRTNAGNSCDTSPTRSCLCPLAPVAVRTPGSDSGHADSAGTRIVKWRMRTMRILLS